MKTNYRFAGVLFISMLLLFMTSCTTVPVTDHLKQGFINPPDSARPGVYWYFMDGNLNKQAMTEDLESMKKAGIGYVLFLEVNVGIPRGKINLLSDEWQDLYRHAIKEAERLGIRVVMGSGPGWAGSGGPWVTPEQSMSHLVSADTLVSGPGNFKGILPVPKPKHPFFGEESLTPDLKKLRDGWYEDVAVLAFPAPSVNLRISDIDNKAFYYRAPYTSAPGVLPFIAMPATFNGISGSQVDQTKIIDLTDKFRKDGSIDWQIPEGKWIIMRFGKRNNGAVTRPAPAPGLGFEADKFDTVSFNAHYNAYIGKLVKKAQPAHIPDGGGWTMIHIDSWEMGAQNWSPHFREEFQKRRGYDPLPWLPVYSGRIVGSLEPSERFLWDLRQTASELIVEYHAGQFKKLGRRDGFRLSVEPYDMNPSADLDLGGVADIPMCEFWSRGLGFNSAFSCLEATSIAHVNSLPVVGAESFTADSPEAWKQYPGRMKDQGDWAFCIGINRFFYHTFAHKPLPDKYRPGMTMGPYGVHWDRGQTWWTMADAYHKYVTRCQFVLSQGKSVSDILYLTPEGAPQVFLPPRSAMEGTDTLPNKKGFAFDGCSPVNLIKNASVKDNAIVFPGGSAYHILVLPDVETMTPALVRKIGDLIKAGATVVGNPPDKSPSLSGYPSCDTEVKNLVNLIWGGNNLPGEISERNFGSGKIYYGHKLKEKTNIYSLVKDSLNLYPDYQTIVPFLEKAGFKPDFTSSGNFRYTHRSLADRDIYFISNKTGNTVTDNCRFRNGSRDAEIWNAVDGVTGAVKTSVNSSGLTDVSVRLEPHQSCFIVFYHNRNHGDIQTTLTSEFSEKKIALTLNGKWTVAFDTTWGGPASVVFDELCDWSKRPEKGIKYYSGTAVYKKSFDLPSGDPEKLGKDIWLDAGELMNMGRVKLNGRDMGVIWTTPFMVSVSGLLKGKDNLLEIEVANLWINRLIGDEDQPWDGVTDGKWPEWLLNGTQRPSKRFTFTTHRFYKKDDPLAPSGLIGPVTLKVPAN